MKGDVNVIDHERLQLHRPTMEYDLPGGARRLLQRADGYVATIVSGEVVVRGPAGHRRAAREPDPRRALEHRSGSSRVPLQGEPSMSKVSLVAKIEAKDGKADELAASFGALFADVSTKAGTIEYVLHRSTTDPNVLYVTEVYENQAALDAHMGSDHFKSFGGSLGDLVKGADLQFLIPIGAGKGLDL